VSTPPVSIVIPAYNESARLASTLPALLEHLADTDAEIVVVDDGSRDDTAVVVRRMLADVPRARIVRLPENRGKGAAVRAGVAGATGDALVFMDADLATDLSALEVVLHALEDADVVVGSRAVPGSVVFNGTRGRALMGRAFNRMVRAVTRLDVHDTQCGFKAFRGPVAKLLFALCQSDGFAFDTEILHDARILGYSIVEVPVTWTAVDGSSVRPVLDSLLTAIGLLRVVIRSRRTRVRAAARDLGWDPSAAALSR